MAERFTKEASAGRGNSPPSAPPVVDMAPELSAWDAFVARSNPGSYLQTSAWAEVKAPNGWKPMRLMGSAIIGCGLRGDRIGALPAGRGEIAACRRGRRERAAKCAFGVQLLVRKPRLFPWAFAYAPRGPVFECWSPATLEAFTAGLRRRRSRSGPHLARSHRAGDRAQRTRRIRTASSATPCGRCGWRTGTPIQPPRTRQVDLRPDESALWGDLRKKWRQYVNKARKGEVRVVDATVERLPEFYSIYRETARRAGFVIRTYESYLGVWQAFARLGMARLLMAEGAGWGRAGDALPAACRRPSRRAVRRHDGGRGR
jgi:lipid II:glycine glycyltransferase (peptidoglycan interpeptide bridge formation enzyme)